MNPSNPYASMLQQQMGPQGMGNGAAPSTMGPPVQARPMQFQRRPEQAPPPKSGGGGMLGGMMSGLSDEHSKRKIEELSSANEALSKALSGAQHGAASHGEFADDPSSPANKVAAQNVGLAPQGQALPPMPQPQQAPRPGFDVQRPAFDMSALDEAYRRPNTTPGT